MLNNIWPLFIIISFVFSLFSGKIEEVNYAIFKSTEDTVEMCLNLLGTMALWNGIMGIAENTKIVKHIKNILKPIIKKLFPKIKEDEQVYTEISMNMVANIMGLGNAATPQGLKAMKSLQEKNNEKKTLSKEMAMFIVINTASIQIIPTTVIAIRNSLESENPTAILFPVWIATACAAIAAIISTKILIKRW